MWHFQMYTRLLDSEANGVRLNCTVGLSFAVADTGERWRAGTAYSPRG